MNQEKKEWIEWRTETRPITDLIPAEYNPRAITEKEKKDIMESIERFGLAEPLVINTNNKIIGGHQRYHILKELNQSVVAVHVPLRTLTDEEERELNIRLNKNTGHFDFKKLAQFDENLLSDIGFESRDLDIIFKQEKEPDEDDAPRARKEVDVKPGDVFLLGDHVIMCGDSTKEDDVKKLMGGKKADMVLTDPPYGVSYADKNSFLNNLDKGNQIQKNIENDEKGGEEIADFWRSAFSILSRIVLADVSSYYVCCAFGGGLFMRMVQAMTDSEMPPRHEIVWVKNNHVLGRCDYNYKHEPILYGWNKRHKFYGGGGGRSSAFGITTSPIQTIFIRR